MENEHSLEGLKIADFSWVIAGPLATKWLADNGATVVRVESRIRLGLLRTYIPMAGGIPGVNRCGSFAQFNSSKHSITLNLHHPRGLEVARRLVAWADVVVENFMPGTMERWHLAYQDLVQIKPDIIMVRASMHGQDGPHALRPGLGTMLQSAAGFTSVLGWPDRPPVGSSSAYTDTIAASYIAVVILGALDRRQRTGRGLYIDLSQFEASVSFLAHAILDYTANGRVALAQGNACPYAAPHGAYPCRGDDAWCTIAVFTDEEWHAFSRVLGEPEWTKEPRFATLLGRKRNEEELNRLVSEWTAQYTPEEVMQRLQGAGVAAGVVENGRDLVNDPQLNHREHFRRLEHPEMGPHLNEAPAFKLLRTPARLKSPAPCLGQDNEHVLTGLLGLSDQEFLELLSSGALE